LQDISACGVLQKHPNFSKIQNILENPESSEVHNISWPLQDDADELLKMLNNNLAFLPWQPLKGDQNPNTSY
jgi:hypothetical protein